MEKLKVQISNRQKQVKIPSGTRLLLRRCCHAVLAYEKFEKPAEVSISFIDNREIKHLNAEFRGKDIEKMYFLSHLEKMAFLTKMKILAPICWETLLSL